MRPYQITCTCGNVIAVNTESVDCVKCGAFYYHNVRLQQKGDYLYVDGKQFALVGVRLRGDQELIDIYKRRRV